jgi:hypothetical protein
MLPPHDPSFRLSLDEYRTLRRQLEALTESATFIWHAAASLAPDTTLAAYREQWAKVETGLHAHQQSLHMLRAFLAVLSLEHSPSGRYPRALPFSPARQESEDVIF